MAAHNPRVITLDWLFERCHPIPLSGCWAWSGSVTDGGYAQVMIGGRRIAAHRVAYALKYGDIPEGMELDHICRVRCCVNPDHVEAVSHSVNVLRGDLPKVLLVRNRSPQMRAITADRNRSPEMRAVTAERNRSEEMRAVVSRPKSPEHAAKIRAMLIERNRSPEMRAIAGRPKSAAHLEAIRQAKLAKRGKQQCRP
jgi:hypothetical protein